MLCLTLLGLVHVSSDPKDISIGTSKQRWVRINVASKCLQNRCQCL